MAAADTFLFTSESVGEGHPGMLPLLSGYRLNTRYSSGLYVFLIFLHLMRVSDKLCDQVSDAVLDAFLKVDPDSRVACGT